MKSELKVAVLAFCFAAGFALFGCASGQAPSLPSGQMPSLPSSGTIMAPVLLPTDQDQLSRYRTAVDELTKLNAALEKRVKELETELATKQATN